jgi:hypothetical protein
MYITIFVSVGKEDVKGSGESHESRTYSRDLGSYNTGVLHDQTYIARKTDFTCRVFFNSTVKKI